MRPLAVAAVALLAGQAQVFRSGVSYVEVAAVVTDKSGGFVRGLAKDDFECDKPEGLRDDGRMSPGSGRLRKAGLIAADL